jgi:hypothetical protein
MGRLALAMSYQELLNLIYKECEVHGGLAGEEEIKREYSGDFDNVFPILRSLGYISDNCPAGSIRLTPAGWRAAKRV